MTLKDTITIEKAAAIAAGALLLGWLLRGVLTAPHDAVVSASYGDWLMVCPTRAATNESCHVTQTLIDKRNGGRLLRLVLGQRNGQPSVATETPANVLLPAGVAFKINDSDQAKTIAYDTCDATGCVADEASDPSIYQSIVSAKKIDIVLALALANRPVVMHISTTGLSDAISAASAAEHKRHSWLWRAFL